MHRAVSGSLCAEFVLLSGVASTEAFIGLQCGFLSLFVHSLKIERQMYYVTPNTENGPPAVYLLFT
jgi:hypothetical protein